MLGPNSKTQDKYIGEHRNGKQHEQGTFTWADGTVNEGIWKNGWLKSEFSFYYLKNLFLRSKFNVFFDNLESYSGDMKNNEYHG